MSNPQRNLILAAHFRPAKPSPYGGRGQIVLPSRLYRSGQVLVANGWALEDDHGWLRVTMAGLVAAGVDMAAAETEAYAMA